MAMFTVENGELKQVTPTTILTAKEPNEYLKNALSEGLKLTIVKKDGTNVIYEPFTSTQVEITEDD